MLINLVEEGKVKIKTMETGDCFAVGDSIRMIVHDWHTQCFGTVNPDSGRTFYLEKGHKTVEDLINSEYDGFDKIEVLKQVEEAQFAKI